MKRREKGSIVVQPADAARETGTAEPVTVATGQWYWVGAGKDRWLGCVSRVGSNYVKVTAPDGRFCRVHFDEFDSQLATAPEAPAVIRAEIDGAHSDVRRLLGDIRLLTAKLSVAPRDPAEPTGGETQAIVAVGDTRKDLADYKRALVRAKDKQLPALFKKVKEANERMATWMKADLIPLQAQAEQLKGATDAVKDRIFHVELYAGLVEKCEWISDGSPAASDEKVRLFQRLCYMDEECLANYEAGGMEYKDIRAFDRWLARPENRDRVLPHPRCAVAFRVRRNDKKRDADSLWQFIRMADMARADAATFLYLRNGDRLYRLNTAIDFGPQLFPDAERAHLAGALWAKVFCDGVREVIPERELKAMREELAEKRRAGKKADDSVLDDIAWRERELDKYEPFAPSSVYHDDIAAKLGADIKHHNRIALILQGLLDRSPVWHPHPPYRLWTADGFSAAIELIYDDSRALNPAHLPDFEAYRARLNASLSSGCMTVGQQSFWYEAERKKDKNWHGRRWGDRTFVAPCGNEGPGDLAVAVSVAPRTKACTYRWTRERQWSRWSEGKGYGDKLPCSITVPASAVLNADAYQPGDFKAFYADPRTRADYLKWAPLLLRAEDYKASKRDGERGRRT